MVHVLLLGDLWRFRRTRLLAGHLHQHAIRSRSENGGFFTAGCVFAGSLVRPIGGNVADRIGGVKSLTVMYVFAAIFLSIVSFGVYRKHGWRWPLSSAPCWRWAWATA